MKIHENSINEDTIAVLLTGIKLNAPSSLVIVSLENMPHAVYLAYLQ